MAQQPARFVFEVVSKQGVTKTADGKGLMDRNRQKIPNFTWDRISLQQYFYGNKFQVLTYYGDCDAGWLLQSSLWT
jgi:hypothetical protein